MQYFYILGTALKRQYDFLYEMLVLMENDMHFLVLWDHWG